ncbi:alpha/beta hydrolase [Nocardia inohanensis]|uniref:alpha/beta hydrolase n=1 Tax=Nocardia inohanensis TaxID=209246 RepID=UPI0009FD6DE5|nr:alpha/beta hydrolase family protein [Nocardia inohanensis]
MRRIGTAWAAGWFAIATVLWPVAAPAEPPGAAVVAADGSRITGIDKTDDKHWTLTVYSAAMDKSIRVDVQRPADDSRPRPTLYLFNGADAGLTTKSWRVRAPEVLDFLAGQDVNLVQPVGGRAAYYADWRAPDPVLGVNKWQTFLLWELPPLIDSTLGTNGVNALAGVSGSATAVFALPIAAPGRYRAAAAYSGCSQISDPVGNSFVRLVVGVNGGNADNMYGPVGDPAWAANDPYVHAEQLRGMELFLSSGTGLPGPYDTTGEFSELPDLIDHFAVDGPTEAGTAYCTRSFAERLAALGIPATVELNPVGMHAWGYFRDEFFASWPTLAKGLGLPV